MMIQAGLLKIAAELDGQVTLNTLAQFVELPAQAMAPLHRDLFLALLRRTLAQLVAQGDLAGGTYQRVLDLLALVDSVAEGGSPWTIMSDMTTLVPELPEGHAVALTLLLLWDALPRLPYDVQYEAVALCYLNGRETHLLPLWQHLLSNDPNFVPDFWQFQNLSRVLSGVGERIEDRIEDLASGCGRPEIEGLFRVYVQFLRQTHYADGLAAAARLPDGPQRQRVADYLTGAAQTNATIAQVVALHEALTGPADAQARAYQQARLAVAEGRWDDVLTLTEPLCNARDIAHGAISLRAQALIHKGQYAEAKTALDHLRHGGHAAWFMEGRADQLRVALHCVENGLPAPNQTAAPALSVLAGKPCAQSLWVGPRLRWIEQASMRSFLANGWRYKLHVYDMPEDVPEGVELLDASAVLPRSELFVEGASSGMHRGSIGAFSDLFRYALLVRRGGMWVDTDVINLDRFEPDGARFIATERMDAGIFGLNGAMMAAPANCPFQRLALDRARGLRAAQDLHFTRIGPQLLAELAAEGHAHLGQARDGYHLRPPDYLNPIGWMETGRLLAPFEKTAKASEMARAKNIHVYTETWRLIGLDLQQPPTDDGFLSVLARRLADPAPNGTGVRQILEGALP
jgi:hypothetical protein